jgi:stringent starvation protein B
MAMNSSRPYLLRALYEWIVDNGCTPYVLVNAGLEGVQVPRAYVKDGQIILNISPTAVADLRLENGAMAFHARFGGAPMQVYVPMVAVLGIYARENGQGMMFEPEETPPGGGDGSATEGGASTAGDKPAAPAKGSGRPSLKVVK